VPSVKCPLQNLYNKLRLLVIHNNEPFSLGRCPLYVKAKLFGKEIKVERLNLSLNRILANGVLPWPAKNSICRI
jgi:hypothetical protein